MAMRTKEEIARELLREADETTAPPSMEVVAVVYAVASEIERLEKEILTLKHELSKVYGFHIIWQGK